MNDKHFNSILLLAIVVTLLALALQQYFPLKRLQLIPQVDAVYYFNDGDGAEHAPKAGWVNEQQRHWRCTYPANYSGYTPCSFNLLMSPSPSLGTDLSSYNRLNIKLTVHGAARKLRFSMRNFNPAYATLDNNNSTKFHSLSLPVDNLRQEVSIGLHELTVADWWLDQLNIPRHLSGQEFNNITQFSIDYAEPLAGGDYDITVEKVELVGEWISAEHWYLLILGLWLVGICSYAVHQLLLLRQQTRHDVEVINALSQTNSQLLMETDKFRRLSTVDPLTQAYNRFGVDQIVASLLTHLAGAEARDKPAFALIVIDIDHFKRINDRRGHDAGDRVLQQVTSLIARGISTKDYLGRWGGEEFIVILPNTRKEFALALAEKIRLMIADSVFEPDNPLVVTASFGISDHLHTDDFGSTFKRADNALYQAKAQGRNCCVMANDQLDS